MCVLKILGSSISRTWEMSAGNELKGIVKDDSIFLGLGEWLMKLVPIERREKENQRG